MYITGVKTDLSDNALKISHKQECGMDCGVSIYYLDVKAGRIT